jgi:hypothetical protein
VAYPIVSTGILMRACFPLSPPPHAPNATAIAAAAVIITIRTDNPMIDLP